MSDALALFCCDLGATTVSYQIVIFNGDCSYGLSYIGETKHNSEVKRDIVIQLKALNQRNTFEARSVTFYIGLQALTNRVRAYVTYSKSQTLQIAVLDYFLTSTFTNTTFHFPDYVKQS